MTSEKWAQKFYTRHYPDLGSDASSVWSFCARFSEVHLERKPVVASPNVGRFLRLTLNQILTWYYVLLSKMNTYFLTLPEVGKLIILIMVIELSGEQFGLKSFDLSQVWFQTKIARHEVELSPYYSQFKIAEFNQYRQWLAVAPDKVARYPPYSLTYILKPC